MPTPRPLPRPCPLPSVPAHPPPTPTPIPRRLPADSPPTLSPIARSLPRPLPAHNPAHSPPTPRPSPAHFYLSPPIHRPLTYMLPLAVVVDPVSLHDPTNQLGVLWSRGQDSAGRGGTCSVRKSRRPRGSTRITRLPIRLHASNKQYNWRIVR